MEISKIKIVSIEGISHEDYPKYCDAFISEATYDGKPMNESELEELNDNSEFLAKAIHDYLY